MKFRKNHVAMKKAMFEAFKAVDQGGVTLIEQINVDVWQSPAITCSRLATAGLLKVHSSTAYDEALQVIKAFAGDVTSKWVYENKGEIAVAHVGNHIQMEIKIKEGSKRNQMLVRFQPYKTNVVPDDLIISKSNVTIRRNQIVINK